ncbi:MAG: ATP-binding protein [Oscillatoriales cyanobacterium C42_A2020_001]|nr:ATP-binding protein [Leptolyngbyaceae cyanobacterium C42_A2020_001]
MVANPFIPEKLVGRQAELYQVSAVLAADGDLLIAGVPGTGRRRLVRSAAHAVGARVLEIDCLRATDSRRFLNLLMEGILLAFDDPAEIAIIRRWSADQPFDLKTDDQGCPRLTWQASLADAWNLFKVLLTLPQAIAEELNCRVVILFQNFPHIRSWDRSEKWESYLRQEIQQQSRVSYALIATVAESWAQQSNMQVVFLGPIKRDDLQPWIAEVTLSQGLEFDSEAMDVFLDSIQGNLGDAIALLHRIWLDVQVSNPFKGQVNKVSLDNAYSLTNCQRYSIQASQIHDSALALVEDLSLTFESLLLLLPASQVRVLESLALDPTDSPHSREYIQKHHLSRGGGLQGALASLQQKGLVYGPEYGYRITMPLLALWLKQKLA